MAKHFELLITPTSLTYRRKLDAIAAEAALDGLYVVRMRERLKPMLFDDEYIEDASAARASPVAKALRSDHAKDASKTADDGSPLHSFRTLLQDVSTLPYNIAYTHLNPEAKIITTTRPKPLQAKAFTLLGLNPACTQ